MLPRDARRWSNLSWGRRTPDPYGRHAWWVFGLIVAALAGILLIAVVLSPVGRDSEGLTLMEALALVLAFTAWFAVTLAVIWWQPRAVAVRAGPNKCLRTRPVRRILFMLIPQAPLWWAAEDWIEQGKSSLVVVSVLLVVSALVWLLTRERFHFNEHGIERIVGIDPRRKVAWRNVTAIRVFPGGVIVEHSVGRPLRVWNRFLDGYPDLAAEMLARIPASVLDADAGSRAILERQAALLRDSAGEGASAN